MATIYDNVPQVQSQPGLADNIWSSIANAEQGAANTMTQGYQESAQATNPLGKLAGGMKELAGAAQGAAAPFAPIFSPVTNSAPFKGVVDTISDNPTLQKFAASPVGDFTADTLQAAPLIIGGTELATRSPAPATAQPDDVLASRTADATPAYNKNLIGQNVQTPEEGIVPRVNEGKGIFGKRTVNTSTAEAASGQELAKIEDYPDKGTALDKSQAVGRAIGAEAESMRAGLQAEDQANPLDTETEIAKLKDTVESHMPPNIQDAIANGKSLPKTAEGTYWKQIIDAANEYDGTREGKLDFRQAADTAYENARGKLAWGSDSANVLDETNTSIRDEVNKDLADTAKNTDTQASLKKQTSLFRAKDVLETKAKAEAANRVGTFFLRHPLLQRLATRDFMRTAATLTGATLISAEINKLLQGKGP